MKAANRRRALELEARDADKPDPPILAHWMRDTFLPHYRELLAQQRRDGAA